jgi:transposase
MTLLTEFQRQQLAHDLKNADCAMARQRIEIMLMADRGMTQKEIYTTLDCSPTTARYWTKMAQQGQAHQWRDVAKGRPKIADDRFCDRLRTLVTQNPKAFGFAFTRWTAAALAHQLNKELGHTVGPRHINRLLHSMGLSTQAKPDPAPESVQEENAEAPPVSTQS